MAKRRIGQNAKGGDSKKNQTSMWNMDPFKFRGVVFLVSEGFKFVAFTQRHIQETLEQKIIEG